MRALILGAAVLAALGLSACGTTKALVQDLTPEAKLQLAQQFLDKCNGGFHFAAGGSAGLGASAHAELDLTGTCGQALVPLSQIGTLVPAKPTEPAS